MTQRDGAHELCLTSGSCDPPTTTETFSFTSHIAPKYCCYSPKQKQQNKSNNATSFLLRLVLVIQLPASDAVPQQMSAQRLLIYAYSCKEGQSPELGEVVSRLPQLLLLVPKHIPGINISLAAFIWGLW